MSDAIQNKQQAVSDDKTAPAFSSEIWIQNILEQTKEDVTASFMPENLYAIVHLKLTNVAQFERLRTDLSKLGVAVGRFDKAVRQQEKSMQQHGAEDKKSMTDVVLGIVDTAEYFHAPDGTAYADIIAEDGHRETWPVVSSGFSRWMLKQCLIKLKGIPGTEALNTVVNTLAARAIIDGQERPVFIRTAVLDDKIYIDLCDKQWRAVEIDKNGYTVIDCPPVRFRRKNGMKPLPVPKDGGTIDKLRDFLNVKDNNGFVLVVSWLLMALRGHGPYPVLAVVGEQGTAKSTLMSLLRQLVDPNIAALRTLPREVRDLFIAASNSLVLAFDNLSYMSDWTSDALCRLSTGGGFATRTLHTNDDEILIDAMRPIMMNGIEAVGTRGDLIDRSIILRLEPIPENKRKLAKQLQAEFDEAYPYIFGALLDMLAHGLKHFTDVQLERPPRMADFALWATACETAAWSRGSFMTAFEQNRAEANDDVIAASALASAICDFLHQGRKQWEGTASNLLNELRPLVDEHIARDRRLWPQTNKSLSERLTRIAPALRRAGVDIERYNGRDHQRLIKLYRTTEILKAAPRAPSAPVLNTVANETGLSKAVTNKSKQKLAKYARRPPDQK